MKISKRLLITIICVAIAICTTTGGTLAYIFSKTESKDNAFEPVFVSCQVEETFDGITKSDVKIRNTGDIKAYIRATFVVMWRSQEGTIHSSTPVEGQDYEITLGSAKWVRGTDGCYYCTSPVHSGEATDILISSISQTSDGPDGFSLSVHVAATAIQAEPATAVEGAWNVTIQSNGELAPQS